MSAAPRDTAAAGPIDEAPRLDARSARDIVEQVARRARLARDGTEPLAGALAQVFGRYCGVLVERLNRAPDLHRDTFLDLLGLPPRPPVPARALLAFTPAAQLPRGSEPVVPAGTEVAAAPGADGGEPVVFETARALVLTRARLARVIAFDAAADRWSQPGAPAQPIPHALYLRGACLAGARAPARLGVEVRIAPTDAAGRPPRDLEWFIPGAPTDAVLAVERDTTRGLTCSGAVVLAGLPRVWPESTLDGVRARWLGVRLVAAACGTPAAPGTGAADEAGAPGAVGEVGALGAVGAATPVIEALSLWTESSRPAVPIERACFDALPLDTSRDFFALGRRPRFGDVFQLEADAFGLPGARVELGFTLTNPASVPQGSPLPPAGRAGQPRLRWEAFAAGRWVELACDDTTGSLTEHGCVSFTVPAEAAATTVAGVRGAWLRARLVAGCYADAAGADAPPSIERVTLACTVRLGPQPPEAILLLDGFEHVARPAAAGAFAPFAPLDAGMHGVYLALHAPADDDLAGRTLDLHVEAQAGGPADWRAAAPSAPPGPARWQYWGVAGWTDCDADDATSGLCAEGAARVRIGPDCRVCAASALDAGAYWLRVLRAPPRPARLPAVGRIALNTVPAEQALTLRNERLGSGSGQPSQTFRTARAPVLGDPVLQVRLPEVPDERQLTRLRAESGDDAVELVCDARGRPQEAWLRWQRVDDLARSGPQARHYLLERLDGRIRFGDGVRGAIPPAGANNVRLRAYRTGGGARGNLPAGAIVQLRAALAHVESVANPQPARGGQNAEDAPSLRRRAAGWVRHRGRAVCADDYADLARAASPDVAWATCFAAVRFAGEPPAPRDAPGVVSLVVVPRSPAPRPVPAAALLQCVRDALDACRPAGTELAVLGPRYLPVAADAQIVARRGEPAADLLQRCEARLHAFLHPVGGGPDGRGWAFGRLPCAADLHAVLAAEPGVDFVRSLHLVPPGPGDAALAATGFFLVCSGEHRLRLLR